MCPYKIVNSRKITTPWITQEIYQAIREKKIPVKKYKNEKTEIILKDLRRARNHVNSLIDKSKSVFIQNALQRNIKKPKKFWKIIKGLIDQDHYVDITSYTFMNFNQVPVDKDETPDFLNNYFANISERTSGILNLHDYEYPVLYEDVHNVFDFKPPEIEDMYGYMLTMDTNTASCIPGINMQICKTSFDAVPNKFRHLFASSQFLGIFPKAWTCACVTLIPKIGDKTNPGNWRPISQTNIFAKILEKIVHGQLLSYFQDNNILSKFQFGFLPEKSTHEAIFNVLRHMYTTINNNKLMGVIFLDIAKAFNCTNHQVLYNKLRDAGMSNRVIDWFRSYLVRTQKVKYGEKLSSSINVSYGIAQGTVLGPLIFIFYINDCTSVLDKLKISLYADDCILYYPGNNWDNIHRIMQKELDDFIAWTTRNNLRPNEGKTKAMIVGTHAKVSKLGAPIPFIINDRHVKFVKQYNYLGIVIDSELSMILLVWNKEGSIKYLLSCINYQESLLI